MATSPAQRRLADALIELKRLHDSGRAVLQSSELDRPHREALARAGFIRPVIQGWYMSTKPEEGDGESTSWYATAREFIGAYCSARFGSDWCVSEDFSVRLHAGDTSLPRTMVIHAPTGTNTLVRLPWNHTLLDYRARAFPEPAKRSVAGGLNVMTLERALVGLPEAFYRTFAREAQIALMSLQDPSVVLRELLEGGRSVVAGRLAAALRALGREGFADELLGVMRRAGYPVKETNPFDTPPPALSIVRGESPYVTRVRHMWATMRPHVLEAFPQEPGFPNDAGFRDGFLTAVREIYILDAYNSLSIEGYKVTEALIARVADGAWNPENSAIDGLARDAMAARGYWQARGAVESSIRRILKGAAAGDVVATDHRGWFRELFAPSVDAGILRPSDLAGYRGHQVYIRNAAHVPPPAEAVRQMMPALFELLKNEASAAVRAVLGHFVFVYIHPYMDGSGRMGRFLMNAMLASGGFPWTVIEVARRNEYMQALDAASSGDDIRPFASFIRSSMEKAFDTGSSIAGQAPPAASTHARTRR